MCEGLIDDEPCPREGREKERGGEFEGVGVLGFTMKIEHETFDFHGIMQI